MDIKELEKLIELKEKGILTKEEFNARKQELLNPTKKATFSWGNFVLGFVLSFIYFNLVFLLFDITSGYAFLMINFLTAVPFAYFAYRLQTSNYKNCAGWLFVLLGITFFGGLGTWIVLYEFLQIIEGNAVEKDVSKTSNSILNKVNSLELNKNSRKVLIGFAVALCVILLSVGIFSHKTENNSYKGPEECATAIKKKHYKEACYINGKSGYTPLIFAIINKESNRIVNKIIEGGANVNDRVPCENTDSEDACLSMLDIAVKYADDPKVVETIIDAGVATRDVTETGLTLIDVAMLHAVEYNENLDVIESLLKQGADINVAEEGYNLLMAASSRNQNPKVVEFLIKKGIDVNAIDAEEATALIYAARQNKNPEIINVLLDNGADVLALDLEGKTALDYAQNNPDVKSSKVYKRLSDLVYEKRVQENKKAQQNATQNSSENEDSIVGKLVKLN